MVWRQKPETNRLSNTLVVHLKIDVILKKDWQNLTVEPSLKETCWRRKDIDKCYFSLRASSILFDRRKTSYWTFFSYFEDTTIVMNRNIICLRTHIIGRSGWLFQNHWLCLLEICGMITFRPSVTPVTGQVAFIWSVMGFIPFNGTSHLPLFTSWISFGSQKLIIGHPLLFSRAGIVGVIVIVLMERPQVMNVTIEVGWTCEREQAKQKIVIHICSVYLYFARWFRDPTIRTNNFNFYLKSCIKWFSNGLG